MTSWFPPVRYFMHLSPSQGRITQYHVNHGAAFDHPCHGDFRNHILAGMLVYSSVVSSSPSSATIPTKAATEIQSRHHWIPKMHRKSHGSEYKIALLHS